MGWNFSNNTNIDSITGYEDVLDKLKTYTKERYINASEKEKEKMKEEVFQIYREKNIFPINYYNENGIINEIQKCVDKEVSFNHAKNLLNLKFNQGQSLCRFLFPNLSKVESKVKNNSMWHRFYDDHKLKRAIDFSLRFKKSVTPVEIRTSLEMIGGNVPTNFKSMNAKALYEKYVPENGIIYDYAVGFGGRMLGALTSKNNYKYFGVEPNTETFERLSILGKYIEEVTNREEIFKIFQMGSEDFVLKYGGYIDFAFSSPPYFNLEKYSDEPTQCYNKFNTLEDWYEGYVRKTIQNIHFMLKTNSFYAVNIADFNIGKERVKLVDKWIQISEEEGFEYVEQIFMKLQSRVGHGHGKEKKEGIFIFQKV